MNKFIIYGIVGLVVAIAVIVPCAILLPSDDPVEPENESTTTLPGPDTTTPLDTTTTTTASTAPDTTTTTTASTTPETTTTTSSDTPTTPDTTETTTAPLPSWIDVPGCPLYDASSCSDQNRVVIFSLDGFKMQYLSKWADTMPYFQKLQSCGITLPFMRASYPTSTFPNHYTMATGLYTESHGIVDNHFNDHELGLRFDIGGSHQYDTAFWLGDPIWNTVTRAGKTSAVCYWVGSDVEVNGSYPDYWYPYSSASQTSLTQRIERVMAWVDGENPDNGETIDKPDLIMAYYEEPDHSGHDFGPDADEIGQVLEELDNEFKVLFDTLYAKDLLNCINLIIVADHGMAPVSAEKTVHLDEFLSKGINDTTVYIREGVPASIGRNLDNPTPWDTGLRDQTKSDLDCNLGGEKSRAFDKEYDLPYRLHWSESGRINDVVLSMEDEWTVKKSRTGWIADGGAHGYDNEQPSMHALFVAMGPAFKDSFTDDTAFQNIELYNVLAGIVGVQPSENNGTTGALNHMMSTEFQFTVDAPEHTDMTGEDQNLNTEITCAQCDTWEVFARDVEELNEQLYLPHDIVEEEAKLRHLPFGVSLPNSGVDSKAFIQRDFVLYTNPTFSSFTFDRRQGHADAAAHAQHCVRPDPRWSDTDCRDGQKFFMFPPSLSKNPINMADALTNINVLPGIGAPLIEFWNVVIREYFFGWTELYGDLNVMVGPIYGEDKTTPKQVFVLVNKNLDSLVTASPQDHLAFILPNWSELPCNADIEDPTYISKTLEMYYATAMDITRATGIELYPHMYVAENAPGHAAVTDKKLYLPEWDTDLWARGSKQDATFTTWRLPYDSAELKNISYSPALSVDVRQGSMGNREWNYFDATSTINADVPMSKLRDHVVIHANGITMRSNPVWQNRSEPTGNKYVEYEYWFYVKAYQYIVLYYPDGAYDGETGDYANIHAGFSNYRGTHYGLVGLYRSQYTDEQGVLHNLLTTQCQTIDARRIFPNFDEPGFKGSVTVMMDYQSDTEDYKVVSNMPAVDYDLEHKTVLFEPTPKMSAYLFAITLTDFDVEWGSNAKIPDTTVGIYGRPSSVSRGLMNHAANITPEIIAGYTDYFDVPYPLPKSDQFGVPDFWAGAMENWGLVIYRESALLFDETMDRESDRKSVTGTIAHELAHQWFGNLVTVSWWNETFLNEGFATYVSFIGDEFTEAGQSYDLEGMYLYDQYQSALRDDAVEDSRPIVDPNVNTPTEISGTFDSISYSKGSAFLRTINGVISEELFVKGLHNYLLKYEYGSASYRDLLESWNEVVVAEPEKLEVPLPEGFDVPTLFEPFLVLNGYPLITVKTCTSDGSKWCASQSRFLYVPGDSNNAWPVSLAMKVLECQGNGTCSMQQAYAQPHWLPASVDTEMELCDKVNGAVDQFPILNYNHKNYYRVWFPEGDTPVPNNEQVIASRIVDDLYAVLKSGQGSLTEYLRVVELIFQDPTHDTVDSPAVHWYNAIASLKSIAKLERHASAAYNNSGLSDEVSPAFNSYVESLMKPAFDANSYVKNNPTQRQLVGEAAILQDRLSSAACDFDNLDCTTFASSTISSATNLTALQLDPNLKNTAYCTAVKQGDSAVWTNFRDYYLTDACQQNSQESRLVRSALGCSTDEQVLTEYLNLIFDKDFIRDQDAYSICSYVGTNAGPGSKLLFPWMRSNIDALYGRISTRVTSCFAYSVQFMSTEQDTNDIEAFYGSLSDELKDVMAVSLSQARSTIQSNMAFRQEYEADLNDYLNNTP